MVHYFEAVPAFEWLIIHAGRRVLLLAHINALGKHVVFGRVIRGFDEVVLKIASVPTGAQDRPDVPVIITNCGELELRKAPPKPASSSFPRCLPPSRLLTMLS